MAFPGRHHRVLIKIGDSIDWIYSPDPKYDFNSARHQRALRMAGIVLSFNLQAILDLKAAMPDDNLFDGTR